MELLGASPGPIVCPNCNATKLHHLASIAPRTELRHFNKILYANLALLWECDIYGNSCLHFAAGSGASLAQLKALASAGAPMKLSNDDGQTFLHVLNTKRYNRETLRPILQWALQEKGGMTKRDSQNRTVWHCLFQHGIRPDVFGSILPCISRNKDDMMTLDSEDHTPLDCLRLYWQRTGEAMAIDYLNLLQSSGRLPLYFAANRTLPLQEAISSVPFCPQPAWLEITSPLPARVPEKARMILFGT
jgi:ankyrin repeat protein